MTGEKWIETSSLSFGRWLTQTCSTSLSSADLILFTTSLNNTVQVNIRIQVFHIVFASVFIKIKSEQHHRVFNTGNAISALPRMKPDDSNKQLHLCSLHKSAGLMLCYCRRKRPKCVVCAAQCVQTQGKIHCPFVWSPRSGNLTLQISSASTAVLFFPSLTPSKANSGVLKRLSSCPAWITQLFMQPPALFFPPPGLYNKRGEMAAGELRSYSGNLCWCGSGGGNYLFIGSWKASFNVTLPFIMATNQCDAYLL